MMSSKLKTSNAELTVRKRLRRDQSTISKMEPATQESGSVTRRMLDMATGFRYGPMVLNTRASGSITKPTGKVRFGTCTETSISGSGAMTKLKEEVSTRMQTGQSMTVSGEMTCSMAMALRCGSMVASMRDSTSLVVNMAEANTIGRMAVATQAIGLKIRLVGRDATSGSMEESTRAVGSITIWMGRGSTRGQMEESMKEATRRIANTASASIHGRMVVATRVCGKKDASMVKAFTQVVRMSLSEQVCGWMVNVKSGYDIFK